MDPLAEIRSKLGALPDITTKVGLRAVLRHLELAEDHHDRARAEDNDDYFNDAVYRANQAYEGALKEAWRVLKGGNPAKKKTHELETGLAASGVLTDRARGLLENYRQEWRNPSTHDHTLLFGEQDAFLAIWSAIAFASVLLDQIVTKVSEEEAASELPASTEEPPEPQAPVDEFLLAYLQAFAETDNAFHRSNGQPRSEAETLGWLSAFLKNQLPDIQMEAHPRLESGVRPDMLLTRGKQRVVLELKRGTGAVGALDSATAQLLSYMDALEVHEGALLIAPNEVGAEMESWVDIYEGGDGRLRRVFVIAPKDRPR